MKKKLICTLIAVLMLTSLIPFGAYAAEQIDSVELSVKPPRSGTNSDDVAPDVTLDSEHCSIYGTNWLYGPNIYTSGDPYLEFAAGNTYYILVTLKADDGYEFEKSGRTATGIDEGFDFFDGCTVSGGDLVFSASRTFNTDYISGDFLRLKIGVTVPSSSLPERITSVSVTLTPPKAGSKAEETDPMSRVEMPDGAHYSATECEWHEMIFDDLFAPFSGTFEAGETYYLALRIDADDGYAFSQGGPYGYTSITVNGGTPLYDTLAVTNYMDDQGGIHSYGTVMIAFTPAGLLGDVNGDGDVNMKDVLLLREAVAGAKKLTKDQESRADVNGDGDVGMKDVLKLRKIIAGAE